MARNYKEVINEMISKIPEDKTGLIKDLKEDIEDANDEPAWFDSKLSLMAHCAIPKEEWEFEILAIFTDKTIDQIKSNFK